MPRRRRSAVPAPTAVTLLGAVLLVLTACGSSGGSGSSSASAAAELKARAQTGLLQSYAATYAVTKADGSKGDSVSVWRTPGRLRLDVRTAAGVATSITTPERTVACQQPTGNRKPTCLVVAGAGQAPPAAFDPGLRKVFGDVLRVFATPGNGLDVTTQRATASPSPSPSATAPAGLGTPECFQVGGSPAPPVAVGTYCLSPNGVPTLVAFKSGTAAILTYTPGAPSAERFVPVVAPTPLPTTAG